MKYADTNVWNLEFFRIFKMTLPPPNSRHLNPNFWHRTPDTHQNLDVFTHFFPNFWHRTPDTHQSLDVFTQFFVEWPTLKFKFSRKFCSCCLSTISIICNVKCCIFWLDYYDSVFHWIFHRHQVPIFHDEGFFRAKALTLCIIGAWCLWNFQQNYVMSI